MHVVNYSLPLAERVSESAFFHAKCAAEFKEAGNEELRRLHEDMTVDAAKYLEQVLRANAAVEA